MLIFSHASEVVCFLVFKYSPVSMDFALGHVLWGEFRSLSLFCVSLNYIYIREELLLIRLKEKRDERTNVVKC